MLFKYGVMYEFPLPKSNPFVFASYHETGSVAVAVRVTLPGPQLVTFDATGADDVLLTIACTSILVGQEPTLR